MSLFSLDSKSIGIIDHGYANIGSLTNTISNLGFKACPIKSIDQIDKYNYLRGFILPGVGSFGCAMRSLRQRKLDSLIFKFLENKIPLMGICLGMQMLAEISEEDSYQEKGLGIFEGTIRKLDSSYGNVPHIAWSPTFAIDSEKKISFSENLNGVFYYIHSYIVVLKDNSFDFAFFGHGSLKVTAAIYKKGILGLQFHPEKSQQDGLVLIKNYFSQENYF